MIGVTIDPGAVDRFSGIMKDMSSPSTVSRPSRFLKVLFGAPSWFYRIGVGWMLGKRSLAVTHRGRRSGQPHQTVLEVMFFDRDTEESVVASAYGPRADWYRNLQAEPALRVQTGRMDYIPEQRFLTPQQARDAAARFCREHPWEARMVSRVLPAFGAAIPIDSESSPTDLLASLPMVAFRPKV